MRIASWSVLVLLALFRPAVAQTAAPVNGPEVSVELTDGSKVKGRLILISPTEVSLRRYPQGPPITHKLTEVRRVGTVHHNRRNFAIAGLGVGLALALIPDWCGTGGTYGSSREPACFTAMPALTLAGSALTGALIGHAIDTRKTRTLFVGPTRLPGGSGGRPGFSLGATFRWARR